LVTSHLSHCSHCSFPRPIPLLFSLFFFTDTPTPEIYTLSLHDALPISLREAERGASAQGRGGAATGAGGRASCGRERAAPGCARSEEHTSELQSLRHLVCRLLLEKKKKNIKKTNYKQ